MRFLRSINPAHFFYVTLSIYFVLGLINLAYIPVPWLDEAALLDPAIQWHKTGEYLSRAWAVKGADSIFLCYPPAIIWFHIINLYVVPTQVFWVRLPFLLLHVSAIFLLYKLLLKYVKIHATWATVCALFFLFDKAVFEISRAMRTEVLEVFLLVLLFILFYKKSRPFYLGLIIGLLLLTHLKQWPLAGTFAIGYFLFFCKKYARLEFMIAIFILPLLFLNFIHFNFTELYNQLVVYSGEHTANGNVLERVFHYFTTRFFPVYKEQPWMPILHLWIFILAIRQLKQDYKKNIFAAVFIVTSLTWMFLLANNYRYWIPLYLVGIMVVATWLKAKKPATKILFTWYVVPVYIVLLFPFVSRHALGILQRNERDPSKAIAFLEHHIQTTEKTLVFGNEISLYMTASHPNMDCGHELEPDNFHFNSYKQVYLVTQKELPQLQLLATYAPAHVALPGWLYSIGRGGTFYGMHIYKVRTETEWKLVTSNYFSDK